MAQSNPFLLAADNSSNLLPLLRATTGLASKQDDHGYSLLHAAASYNHIDLLRSLVNEFHVNINLKDEDAETCLFVTETLPIAQCLVEELHIDVDVRNNEGLTAAEKFVQDGDFPEVASYLQSVSGTQNLENSPPGGVVQSDSTHPPRLPPNVTINVGTVSEQPLNEDAQEPDPEFRRRIEELAAKENFHSEEGQRELRDLITDALRGTGESRDVRRRVE